MKFLILFLTPLFMFASGQTLTPIEHNSIHGYNNRPIVKMNKKQKMHKLHKVNEDEARKITKKITKENTLDIKLIHSGKILKYFIKTKSYNLSINALDGSLIKKELKN